MTARQADRLEWLLVGVATTVLMASVLLAIVLGLQVVIVLLLGGWL